MFFTPPNRLPAKSIHLDHCLLRVFESLLPLFPHTICLSSLASSQQPSFNHFFITPPSLQPVHSLPPSPRRFPLPALNIHTITRRPFFFLVPVQISCQRENSSANDGRKVALTPGRPDSQQHVSRLSCWPAHYHLELLAAQTTHPHGLSLTPDRN